MYKQYAHGIQRNDKVRIADSHFSHKIILRICCLIPDLAFRPTLAYIYQNP